MQHSFLDSSRDRGVKACLARDRYHGLGTNTMAGLRAATAVKRNWARQE